MANVTPGSRRAMTSRTPDQGRRDHRRIVMGKNPLNHRQQRFVDEFIVDLNCTQAAVRAGYSVKTAKQIGSRLLTHVDVERIRNMEAVKLKRGTTRWDH